MYYIRIYSQDWDILDNRLITFEVRTISTSIKAQVSNSQRSPSLELETCPEPHKSCFRLKTLTGASVAKFSSLVFIAFDVEILNMKWSEERIFS